MSEHDHRIVDDDLLFEYNALVTTVQAYLDGVFMRTSLEYQMERVGVARRASEREQEADPNHHTEYVRRTLAVLEGRE